MLNIKETLRALVSAFNVYNYARDTVETNFTLEDKGGKEYIVVSFDKGMGGYQCTRYLSDIKRKIVSEFYSIKKEDTDEVVLNTAKLIFDIESFPFSIDKGEWFGDKHHGFKFATPVDKGVIRNLKSHLASSLKKDILEGMQVSSKTTAFDKEKYLWHDEFSNAKLRKQFEKEFSLRVKKRYKNVPRKLLKVKGNDVYMRNIFDDVRFIDNITQYVAWLIGMDLGVSNSVDYKVKLFKGMIIEYIDQSTGVVVDAFLCTSPLGRKEASVLIPVTQSYKGIRFITKEEARIINSAFDNIILNDISGRTQAELSVNGNNAIYGIDFSNPEISHCVITKIIENSVINKNHELSIDTELRFQALSQLPSLKMPPTQLESPRRESWLLSFLQYNVDSSNQSQRSIGVAAVDAESEQVACARSPSSLVSGERSNLESGSEHSKAKSKENRASSKSKGESLKKHGPFFRVKSKVKDFFSKSDQHDKNFKRSNTVPVYPVSKKLSFSRCNSLPSKKSNLFLKESSPTHSPSGNDVPVLFNNDSNKIQIHAPYQPPSNGSGIASQATNSSDAKVSNLMLSINCDLSPTSPFKPSLSSYMLCKSWPTKSHGGFSECFKTLSEVYVIQARQQFSKGVVPRSDIYCSYVDEVARKR